MAEPIFNLVRVDDIETSEGLDYSASSDMPKTYDEVLLVDDQGEPCAEPVAPSVEDLDERHEFTTGAVGSTQRIMKHNLSIPVEGLSGDAMAKLRKWKQERAQVRFAPGFGRHTELAWRPVEGGSSYKDLTGRYTLNEAGDATYNHVWDERAGVMRSFDSAGQRIIPTPGGAGQVFEKGYANLAYGQAWAVNAGPTTTVATESYAFGHTDFPSATRITRGAADSVGRLSMALTGGTFGSPSVLNASLPIKGRVPPGTYLEIRTGIGAVTVVSVVYLDEDYADWTMVNIQAATTFTSGQWLYIKTPDSSGTDTSGSFLVGPVMAYEDTSSAQYCESFVNYVNKATAPGNSYLTTSAAVKWPRNGSVSYEFYCPESFDDTLDGQRISLFGPTSSLEGTLYLCAYNSVTRLRAIYYLSYPAPSYALSPYIDADQLNLGAVNTITVTWSGSSATMYLNGAQIGATSVNNVSNQTDRAMYIGYSGVGAGSWPMVPLSMRLENDVWSADRVAWEHATNSNAAAHAPVIGARGRTYRIRSLPQQAIGAVGPATWRGVIELEQVSYTAALADVTSKE